jgi:capsular polysaccharide biosynthesis protein
MPKEKNIKRKEDFHYADEIDLQKYVKAALKRKKFIFLLILLSVVIVLAIDFVTPRTYTAISLVRIGRVSELNPETQVVFNEIKSDNSLSALFSRFGIKEDSGKIRDKINFYESADTGLVVISVQDKQPEMAMKICNAIAGDFVSKGNLIYHKKKDDLDKDLYDLDRRIQDTQAMISVIKKKIPSVRFDQTQEFLTLQDGAVKHEQLCSDLKDRMSFVKQRLSSMRQYEVYADAKSDNGEHASRITEDIIIGLMFGLTLGLLLVFVRI